MEAQHTQDCSRELSRKVRNYLKKELYPFISINPIDLPQHCQLNPTNDLFFQHENHKRFLSQGEWKCEYCSKIFKNEFYLDKHLENKHQDRIIGNNNSMICLADLCPVFGCKSSESQIAVNRENTKSGNFDFEIHKTSCASKDLEKAKYKCEILSRKCFEDLTNNSESEISASEYFRNKVCNKLKCYEGTLQGALVSSDMSALTPQIIFSYRTLQAAIAFVIIVFVIVYALCVGLTCRRNGGVKASKPQLKSKRPPSRYSSLFIYNSISKLLFDSKQS